MAQHPGWIEDRAHLWISEAFENFPPALQDSVSRTSSQRFPMPIGPIQMDLMLQPYTRENDMKPHQDFLVFRVRYINISVWKIQERLIERYLIWSCNRQKNKTLARIRLLNPETYLEGPHSMQTKRNRQAADTAKFRLHLIIFLETNISIRRQMNIGYAIPSLGSFYDSPYQPTCIKIAWFCTHCHICFDDGESDSDGDVRLTCACDSHSVSPPCCWGPTICWHVLTDDPNVTRNDKARGLHRTISLRLCFGFSSNFVFSPCGR